MHLFLISCAAVSFCGSSYVGCVAFQMISEDLESHSVGWPQIGADVLFLGCAVAGLITSLHSFVSAVF